MKAVVCQVYYYYCTVRSSAWKHQTRFVQYILQSSTYSSRHVCCRLSGHCCMPLNHPHNKPFRHFPAVCGCMCYRFSRRGMFGICHHSVTTRTREFEYVSSARKNELYDPRSAPPISSWLRTSNAWPPPYLQVRIGGPRALFIRLHPGSSARNPS